jgi:hypothetical protein
MSYATCQSVIGCEVDSHVHLIVFVKRLDGRDHFEQITYLGIFMMFLVPGDKFGTTTNAGIE